MDPRKSDDTRDKGATKFLIVSGDKRISYTKDARDKIFSNSIERDFFHVNSKNTAKEKGIDLKDKLFLRFDEKTGEPLYSDKVNTYTYNSDGYRSPEFDGSAKILYAGCSNTFGTGVPEERIWGSVVADHFNMPYANLSKQGTSTQWIVKNIFAYFEKYGHPEIVCCLFPDFYRMILASNSSQLVYINNSDKSPVGGHGTLTQIYEVHLSNTPPVDSTPEYSRRPHSIVDVIPADTAVYSSIQSVLMLDQYCRANNIKFAWSTWEPAMLAFLHEIKPEYPNNYSNLVNLDIVKWIKNPDKTINGDLFCKDADKYVKGSAASVVDCHTDLKEKYELNFYRGLDDLFGADKAHFGVHKHTHIAEAFIDFLQQS